MIRYHSGFFYKHIRTSKILKFRQTEATALLKQNFRNLEDFRS
jgi:hypothetical protein